MKTKFLKRVVSVVACCALLGGLMSVTALSDTPDHSMLDADLVVGEPVLPEAAVGKYTYSSGKLSSNAMYNSMHAVAYPLSDDLPTDADCLLTTHLSVTQRYDEYMGPVITFRRDANGNQLGIWFQRDYLYFGSFAVDAQGAMTFTPMGSINNPAPDGFDGQLTILSTVGYMRFSLKNSEGEPVPLYSDSISLGSEHGWSYTTAGVPVISVSIKGSLASFSDMHMHQSGEWNMGMPIVPTACASHYSVNGFDLSCASMYNEMYLMEYPISQSLDASKTYTVNADIDLKERYDYYSGPIILFRKNVNGGYLGFWFQTGALYYGTFTANAQGALSFSYIGEIDNPLPDGFCGNVTVVSAPDSVHISVLDKNGQAVTLTYGGGNVIGKEHSWGSAYVPGGAPFVGVSLSKTAAAFRNVQINTSEKCRIVLRDGVTADRISAKPGDNVTLKVVPPTGKQLRAGTLEVTDKNGKSIKLYRAGYQTADTQSRKFSFTMPDSAVTVKADFYALDAGESGANMTSLGVQYYYRNDKLDGIRFGTQAYVDLNKHFTVNGKQYTLSEAGTLIVLSKNLESLSKHLKTDSPENTLTLDTANNQSYGQYVIHVKQTKVYDKTDDYFEFVGGIVNLSEVVPFGTNFSGRGYLKATDGTVFYTDIIERSFGDPMHNVVLMYPAMERDEEKTKPYVAQMKDGKPTEWLFDTFVYLKLLNTSGSFADNQYSTKADWEGCLDRFFDPNTDIPMLEKAIEEVKADLGNPPGKRNVLIGIPYPHKATVNFGDVDNDGLQENFQNINDRRKVLNWYIQEAISRFDAYHFENLNLWGFYWMEESMPEDEVCVATARDLIHDAGYQFMWIPCYTADNLDKGNEYFDVTILQPNYAFNAWTSLYQTTGPERLMDTWDICETYGYGIEMEIRGNSEADVNIFRQYLSYGADNRLGYQKAVNGFYLGAWFVEETYSSNDPRCQAIYDMLCDYVTGKPVSDPDIYYPLMDYDGSAYEIACGTTDPISNILLFADTEKLGNWTGILKAEFRNDGVWQPGGWLYVTSDKTAEGTRSLSIPTSGKADRIRLTAVSDAALPVGAVLSLSVDHTSPHSTTNYCLNKPYTLNPQESRTYNDNSTKTKLCDGTISSSNVIGWWHRKAKIIVDLGGNNNVSAVEVYMHSSYAPERCVATISDQELPLLTGGVGAVPSQVASSSAYSSSSYGSGITRYTLPVASTGVRYVQLIVEPQWYQWIRISEICVKNGNTTLPISSYRLLTLPESNADMVHSDYGFQLTDGNMEYTNDNACVAWDTCTSTATRELTVDLEETRTINEMTLWSIVSPVYGNVYCVADATFYTSMTGESGSWTPQGTIKTFDMVQEGERIYSVPLTCVLSTPTQARYVRVDFRGRDNTVCSVSEFTAK